MTTPLFPSSSTDFSTPIVGRVAAGLAGVLFALAVLAAPLQAQPTSPVDSDPGQSTWQQNYGEQTAALLRSDIDQKKSLALKTLLTVTAADRAVDLSPTVPALFEIYESDATLNHRIMAATALRQVAGHSPSGDRIMERLGALVADQSSEHVQRLTLLVLADYETAQGRALQVTPNLYDLIKEQGRA
jgi:hypothetical protein